MDVILILEFLFSGTKIHRLIEGGISFLCHVYFIFRGNSVQFMALLEYFCFVLKRQFKGNGDVGEN